MFIDLYLEEQLVYNINIHTKMYASTEELLTKSLLRYSFYILKR